jgi:DNA-binding transcriptional regulator YiaG
MKPKDKDDPSTLPISIGNMFMLFTNVPYTVSEKYGPAYHASVIENCERLAAQAILASKLPITGPVLHFCRSVFAMSSRELAQLLDVSHPTILQWEKFDSEIPLASAIAFRTIMAEKLGVDIPSHYSELKAETKTIKKGFSLSIPFLSKTVLALTIFLSSCATIPAESPPKEFVVQGQFFRLEVKESGQVFTDKSDGAKEQFCKEQGIALGDDCAIAFTKYLLAIFEEKYPNASAKDIARKCNINPKHCKTPGQYEFHYMDSDATYNARHAKAAQAVANNEQNTRFADALSQLGNGLKTAPTTTCNTTPNGFGGMKTVCD